MTASTFGLLPDAATPVVPAAVSGEVGVALDAIPLLRQTPVAAVSYTHLTLPTSDLV